MASDYTWGFTTGATPAATGIWDAMAWDQDLWG
jgi:hypothetical protein